MTSNNSGKQVSRLRKAPTQERSTHTVALIVETAAQLLEQHGLEGFNTNAVAQRARISIGSVYQYFPNKQVLIRAVLAREDERLATLKTKIAQTAIFNVALELFIEGVIQYRLQRPALSRVLDVAESRDRSRQEHTSISTRLAKMLEKILQLSGSPVKKEFRKTAEDILAMVRVLVDAACGREEKNAHEIQVRIERAILGYLG